MKKYGFTLVELLAVVAILGILVLLAMPSVIRTLKKGDRKIPKMSIGRIVKKTKMNLLGTVILCIVSHSLHLIGL